MKICRRFWKRKMWVFQIIRYSYRYLAMIPVSVGDLFHKICKLTYYGKTTLDLNSIGIFFIKSTIIVTIFILRGHKCFKDKISWHNIHWATSKELCRNGVKIIKKHCTREEELKVRNIIGMLFQNIAISMVVCWQFSCWLYVYAWGISFVTKCLLQLSKTKFDNHY